MFPPCWLMWRAKVVGRENLPQTVPYVLAPVHRSYIDTLLAAYVTTRRLRFMAKEEVFSRAWSARLFGSLGGFPVRRGTPDREALPDVRAGPGRAANRWCCSPRAPAARGRWSSRCSPARPSSPCGPTCPSCPSA